ncbi:hypothetical protein, partial [Pluralibacter gergoviae]|uniref:hypothetical protein n=1 Tax=Pluralibacter gergoviae TaxID=61647 RepID=UPI001A993761
LLGRGRQESLIGAYEKPPAMPEDTYCPELGILLNILFSLQTFTFRHFPGYTSHSCPLLLTVYAVC